MSVTIEYHDGAVTYLSDAGQAACAADAAKYAEDQRLTRVDRLYTEIKLGALGGAIITLAALVIKQLLGI